MASCTECRSEIPQDAAYCPHCGKSQTNVPENVDPPLQPAQKGGGFRKVLKWTGIGCGGLIGLFVLLIIIGIIASAVEDDTEEESVAKAGSDRETKIAATAPQTRMPAAMPTPTPMPAAVPTPTPVPTATPTPMPLQMELTELLEEYDQNKVRANTRLRYQENGNIPVSTSGYVDEVEEHYVVVTPSQERYSSERLYCYYADTGTALHLTKGQLVSVTGRVSSRASSERCAGLLHIGFNLFPWVQRHRRYHRCPRGHHIDRTSRRRGRERVRVDRG